MVILTVCTDCEETRFSLIFLSFDDEGDRIQNHTMDVESHFQMENGDTGDLDNDYDRLIPSQKISISAGLIAVQFYETYLSKHNFILFKAVGDSC